jgi:hypothetical protein
MLPFTGQLTRRQCLFLALSTTVAARPAATGRKLEPPTDSPRDEELTRFLDNLAAIVARCDERGLLSLVGSRFRVEFSDGKGRDAFRRFWQTDQPNSTVWTVLSRLLTMDGAFYSPTLFAIPYVYTEFPVDLDPFAHVAALGPDIIVNREARPDSAAVATLAFDIVPADPALTAPVRLDRTEWVRVITPQGDPGFVAAREVWSPAAHRMFFEKRKGRWEWISLVCSE